MVDYIGIASVLDSITYAFNDIAEQRKLSVSMTRWLKEKCDQLKEYTKHPLIEHVGSFEVAKQQREDLDELRVKTRECEQAITKDIESIADTDTLLNVLHPLGEALSAFHDRLTASWLKAHQYYIQLCPKTELHKRTDVPEGLINYLGQENAIKCWNEYLECHGSKADRWRIVLKYEEKGIIGEHKTDVEIASWFWMGKEEPATINGKRTDFGKFVRNLQTERKRYNKKNKNK